ncbi:hypothetical protein GCM10022214_27010 [Actinomadura miaoliensis]|uniref:Uncharacterized protein n=1 Tax=Actinomadura miaoliensis TaxID=430685 RepID=A0ABP7VLW6_9ACTN
MAVCIRAQAQINHLLRGRGGLVHDHITMLTRRTEARRVRTGATRASITFGSQRSQCRVGDRLVPRCSGPDSVARYAEAAGPIAITVGGVIGRTFPTGPRPFAIAEKLCESSPRRRGYVLVPSAIIAGSSDALRNRFPAV